MFVLTYDLWMATQFHQNGNTSFGVSVGTGTVTQCNIVGGYTLGVLFRHMIGGIRNRFRNGGGSIAEACWKSCTKLNKNHNKWAIYSLF